MDKREKKCPHCGARTITCPECGRIYRHGQSSHCENPECRKVNAPLDCRCGYVVSANLNGVLDVDMKLLPY